MRPFFTLLFISFLLFACGSDTETPAGEVAKTSADQPEATAPRANTVDQLNYQNICAELPRRIMSTAIPGASGLTSQPVQGAKGMIRCGVGFILDGKTHTVSIIRQEDASDAAGFAGSRAALVQKANGLKIDPPQDIEGLEGNAFVVGGPGGGAKYFENGNLWQVSVQDNQGTVNTALSVAVLKAMLAS